jgi:predicted nucleic acid-binding protein
MNFANLATGDAVFVDANILTYHFEAHARWGLACTQLLQRIENQQLAGYTSTQVISEGSHRLMTIEAHRLLSWPVAGIGNRLRTNPTEVLRLGLFRTAVENLLQSRLHLLAVTSAHLATGVALSQRIGLLTNDALIVAVMQANGLTKIASNDADFDRVPGLTRYPPRLTAAAGVRASVAGRRAPAEPRPPATASASRPARPRAAGPQPARRARR